MNDLYWSDKFSIGVEEIDDHHRSLFRILNTLRNANEMGAGQQVISVILDQMYDYTLYHFTAEESLMDKYDFPELGLHSMEHLNFLVQVKGMKKRLDSGEGIQANEVYQFLLEWLKAHTLGSDQQMGPFLNARGVH